MADFLRRVAYCNHFSKDNRQSSDLRPDGRGIPQVRQQAFKCRENEPGLSFYLHDDDLDLDEFWSHPWLPSGDKPGVVSIDEEKAGFSFSKTPSDDKWSDQHYETPCPNEDQRRVLAGNCKVLRPFLVSSHDPKTALALENLRLTAEIERLKTRVRDLDDKEC